MKDDNVYLVHIFECIKSIQEYVITGEKEFFDKKIIQDAVVRNLEIIGEASKKISQEFKLNHTDIPWKEMSGLRNVLIHDYFGVDLKIVWNVVAGELPKILNKIISILK